MSGLRGVTLTARFLCELAMLAELAYWGFAVGDGVGAWLLGVGAPLLAAFVWGAMVAPKARWPVPTPTRVVIELILFGAAAGALAVAGQPLAAVVLGVAGLTTSLLNASQDARRATDHRFRRLVVYVHAVVPSAVGAGQVSVESSETDRVLSGAG